ncbi:hypothetical protein BG005_005177, partial [Podila minutissima]
DMRRSQETTGSTQEPEAGTDPVHGDRHDTYTQHIGLPAALIDVTDVDLRRGQRDGLTERYKPVKADEACGRYCI